MPKSAANRLTALVMIAVTALCASCSKNLVNRAMSTTAKTGASATVMIEVIDPGTGDADKPQNVSIGEFIVSDTVLLPTAETFTRTFPDQTVEEIANEFRSHLDVTPIQNVFRLHCSINPPQVALQVLQEVTNRIPGTLETALWPNGKSQQAKFKILSRSKDELTIRLAKLEKDYLHLQQTTPVIIHSGGEAEVPKVLTDKRNELETTREQYEATIAALAIQQLKPNYSLQFHVLEAPTVHTASEQ